MVRGFAVPYELENMQGVFSLLFNPRVSSLSQPLRRDAIRSSLVILRGFNPFCDKSKIKERKDRIGLAVTSLCASFSKNLLPLLDGILSCDNGEGQVRWEEEPPKKETQRNIFWVESLVLKDWSVEDRGRKPRIPGNPGHREHFPFLSEQKDYASQSISCSVAPYRAILRRCRCDTHIARHFSREVGTPPRMLTRMLPLMLSFT